MNGSDASAFRIVLGIATKGRPQILGETLRHLRNQTLGPDRIVVCCTSDADRPATDCGSDIVWLKASPGSAHQRNVILDHSTDVDAVLFIDDDFLMQPDYLATTVQAMQAHPDIVVTTGYVIADGARGPGYTTAQGETLLARDAGVAASDALQEVHNGYGCNMCLRLDPIHRYGLRFDEALPLYGWYEDIDLTRRLGRHGTIMRIAAARGVHLGTKTGRGSGRKLGYSQVINPIYLARKGSYEWSHAIVSIGRNVAANCVGAVRPEAYVDRRGRLVGNALALFDLLRGIVNPRRILTMG